MRKIKKKELQEIEVAISTLIKLEKERAYTKNNKIKNKRKEAKT